MRVALRIQQEMLNHVRRDLERPHEFAFERVGFVFCRFGWLDSKGIVVLAHDYLQVSDDEYIDDDRFGALVGASAFRRALEHTLNSALGIFHIHLHAHAGLPTPSRIDLDESAKFVPDFFHVRDRLPHGALIASRDSISGRVWLGEAARPTPITEISVVGSPLQLARELL